MSAPIDYEAYAGAPLDETIRVMRKLQRDGGAVRTEFNGTEVLVDHRSDEEIRCAYWQERARNDAAYVKRERAEFRAIVDRYAEARVECIRSYRSTKLQQDDAVRELKNAKASIVALINRYVTDGR